MFQNFLFDLDGTILDTIEGIRDAVNESLLKCGYTHQFDRESTKTLIGDGARMCLIRALKEKGSDEEAVDELAKVYMPSYAAHQLTGTSAFPDVLKVLPKLKEGGRACFVVTNKPDKLAKIIVPKYYGNDLFEDIEGHHDGDPVKPDPKLVNLLIEKHGLKKEETLFVGDSHVDIETGHNAGLKACLVTWGYDKYDEELKRKADYVISSPEELLGL